MSVEVVVAGVGMIPFTKPGASEPFSIMGERAARLALEDAGLEYRDVQHAYAGFIYADLTAGQAALYGLGLSGIPIFNVNNACASGSTALYLARQAVEAGVVDCALAVGFDQMNPGALGPVFHDRPMAAQRFADTMDKIQGLDPYAPGTAQFYGGAAREYMAKYGAEPSTFAMISTKARRHASANPFALFQAPVTTEEVLASKQIYGVVTRLQCCPPTCGAAAAIVTSADFAKRRGVKKPVRIAAQAMTTDLAGTFDASSMIKLIGFDMAAAAAKEAYEIAGVDPSDVDVVEMHDCFTVNEFIMYEALGLAPVGGAEKFVRDEANTYGGQVVINPSGGLLSRGHPLGATGLAQCTELVWQMRGDAGKRQVENTTVALQHNLGLGGTCVITIYTM